MYIQTENTPNPNAIKFLPNREISPNHQVHFSNVAEAAKQSRLAVELFAIHGVAAVFFGHDFITITKNDDYDWVLLKPEILMTIQDYLLSDLPILNQSQATSENNDQDLSEIEKQIIELIETRVRPSVAMDGGDIVYVGFEDGIVKLALKGACGGCPSASITLKHGIESMLQHYIPEVKGVEAV